MKKISILAICIVGLLLASGSFAASGNEFTQGITGQTCPKTALIGTAWTQADTEFTCDGTGQGRGEIRRDGNRRGGGRQDGSRRGGGKRDGTGREDGSKRGDCDK